MRSTKDIFLQRAFFTIFWVLASFGFISQEIIPPLAVMLTPVNLLCDGLLVVLGIMTIRNRKDILVIASFIIISFTSTITINDLGMYMWINGSRVFFSVLCMYPILRYFWNDTARHEAFVKRLDKHFFFFLVLQAFCVTEQWIRYGAGDTGGGSLGDGYSGVVSFSIYFISFYLMQKRSSGDDVLQNIKSNIWLVILLFPTFLNETKVSFILLLLYFILLFPINRKFVKRIIIALPFMLIILGGAVLMYLNTANNAEQQFDLNFLANSYLYEEADVDQLAGGVEWVYENESNIPDVPRFTKMAFVPLLLNDDGGHWLMGYGTGLYNGSNDVNKAPVIREYEWFFIGTIPYWVHVIMQIGILGCILIIYIFVRLFREKIPGYVRNKNMIAYAIIALIISLFYSDLFRTPPFTMVFFSFVFLSQFKDNHKKEDNITNKSLITNEVNS